MREFDLPTADFQSFACIEEARTFIEQCPWKTIVVKADGLAAGKGVVVAGSREEALEAASVMLMAGPYLDISPLFRANSVRVVRKS